MKCSKSFVVKNVNLAGDQCKQYFHICNDGGEMLMYIIRHSLADKGTFHLYEGDDMIKEFKGRRLYEGKFAIRTSSLFSALDHFFEFKP